LSIVTTSEGGHHSNKNCITSEGASKGTQPFPHKLDFWDMGSANNAIPLGSNHLTKTPMMNEFLHPASGKEIKYKAIMQHPTMGPKYKTGFGNELGRLCQGIRDTQGTNTCFFF
jgi:hypothetical protein